MRARDVHERRERVTIIVGMPVEDDALEPTLRAYFERFESPLVLSVGNAVKIGPPEQLDRYTVDYKLHHDTGSQTVYFSVWIAADVPVTVLLVFVRERMKLLETVRSRFEHATTTPGESELRMSDADIARVVHAYVDALLPPKHREQLELEARKLGAVLVLRDRAYADRRRLAAMEKRPIAFIVHDSRDKDAVARPLWRALMQRFVGERIWFDETELRVGSRLRERIELGLKECDTCILVISKNFVANAGWTREEFNSVFSRELLEKRDLILPVWVDVTKEDVFQYSPILANRMAAIWTDAEAAATALEPSIAHGRRAPSA